MKTLIQSESTQIKKIDIQEQPRNIAGNYGR